MLYFLLHYIYFTFIVTSYFKGAVCRVHLNIYNNVKIQMEIKIELDSAPRLLPGGVAN